MTSRSAPKLLDREFIPYAPVQSIFFNNDRLVRLNWGGRSRCSVLGSVGFEKASSLSRATVQPAVGSVWGSTTAHDHLGGERNS